MSETENIIALVQKYDILYDKSHPYYKNNRTKDEVWDEVGTTLGLDGETVKKKWKSLKDCYVKHLRSEQDTTGEKSKLLDRYRAWPWANHMAMFKPYFQDSIDTTSTNNQPNRSRPIKPVSYFNTQSESTTDKVLEYINNRAEIKYDDVDLICLGYAKTIKKFSASRQTQIKFEIAQLMMKHETEHNRENVSSKDIGFVDVSDAKFQNIG